ncbi:hypothetical protein JD488_03455 [Aeromonas jandaei]|uniref:DUF6404 family protein n=1 Tax=Aeromonas jandaei TaxID=650 RepID=UPI00191EA023|nr:DUF6404 family protein [Aeromonas jandaei]MBL0665766.1 hypothetical protein [Aeromonas jandaei]
MTFEERLAAAHQELASKGVWHANYNPPLFWLLRQLGWPVKPPHYGSWLTNLLVFGVGLGLIWSTMMWLFSWQSMGIDPLLALRHTALFAGLTGLVMASLLWLRRKQLKLTPWEQLANPADADDEEEELNEIP